jgi:hypothetical protein
MFMYLRVPQPVLETCLSLAATSIRAEFPSGKAPTTYQQLTARDCSGEPIPQSPSPWFEATAFEIHFKLSMDMSRQTFALKFQLLNQGWVVFL